MADNNLVAVLRLLRVSPVEILPVNISSVSQLEKNDIEKNPDKVDNASLCGIRI